MVYGVVPLLVIAVVTLAVLASRFGTDSAPVREATQSTRATVVASQLGPDRHQIDLSWTDRRSVTHTSRLRFPKAGKVAAGTTVDLHYDPADTSRVFVSGDETSTHLNTLATDIVTVVLLGLAALVTTAVRIGRRRLAERRPAQEHRLSVAHSSRGVISRAWLTGHENGNDWWLPVYWDPVLDRLDRSRPYPVHGAANPRGLWTAEVDGTPIWPAGRRRVRTPRGEVSTDIELRDEPRRISMLRHLRGDLAPVFAAPLLGLLWAYVDDAGAGGFWASTAVLAGVLFWLPSLFASDPT